MATADERKAEGLCGWNMNDCFADWSECAGLKSLQTALHVLRLGLERASVLAVISRWTCWRTSAP